LSRTRGAGPDRAFKIVVGVSAAAIPFLLLLYFLGLTSRATPTLSSLGLGFLHGTVWNPSREIFGVLPMIYGSVVTSAIALLIGVPVSLGVAIFLSEIAPKNAMRPISFLVEMLAAVPSVIYGLWGIFVLIPFLRSYVYPDLQTYLGFLPVFQGNIFGFGMLTAGIILSIMIIPIVSAISRDALRAVPDSQREALYALGATRSEVIRTAVLGYARPGVIAAIFLGFGRAFGETMAVTMLIGNTVQISSSLFAPGYTLASLVANQFSEAIGSFYISALIEVGLVLLLVSLLANLGGRLLVRRFLRSETANP
jgi:phosphate transport system permease protein